MLQVYSSSSRKPLKITLGSFQIFSKDHGDICKSRCTTGVNVTSGKFDAGVAAGVNYTGGNLPPVSKTPAANFATSTTPVVDTSGK